MSEHRGNNPAHILAQLERIGRHDLAAGVRAGKFSAHTAAVAAGIRERPPTMRLKTVARKWAEFKLYPPGRAARDMEVWLGPPPDGRSEFASEADARQYWFAERDRLWPLLARDARRPWAFWYFEAGPGATRWFQSDYESAILYEAGPGFLADDERAALVRGWREEFDRSFSAGFFVCMGPGEILHGVRAQFAHFRACGIAVRLVRLWWRERRRTIGKLVAAE
jgi:hypothetical protein